MAENKLVISTILLNWNRIDNLDRTINSYLKTIDVEYELIIVDNNSKDGSPELIKSVCANRSNHHAVMLDKNIGGSALNIGADMARGKYIHFSENDIEYLPGWCESVLEKFDNFPELGQLSLFSPNPQQDFGEISSTKEVKPITRNGITIYVTEQNSGTTSIIRRQIWDLGIRWKSYGKDDIWFPDDGTFSHEVRNKGFVVAYNDKYVVINWGHNIQELNKELPYYIENYRSKVWFGIEGFRSRLKENGYDLITNSVGLYEIVKNNVTINESQIDDDSHNTKLNRGSQLLWDDPNKYARPAKIEVFDDHMVMHGYQEFTLTKNTVTIADEDMNLKKKQELLEPYFTPRYLCHRNILDLGASNGYFCFWAIQNGADKATALDMDQNYLALIKQAVDKFNFGNIDITHTNITDWDQPADVTIALALVHWIYSCTAVYGTIDSVIDKISRLTGYMSIIEWVDPNDPAIEFFHHTDWNKAYINGPYNRDEFEKALSNHFKRYLCIGEVNPTRKIYIAFKNELEIDLSGPLPFLLPVEKVIYSRWLATYNGIEYWSRIYDAGDSILKQSTLDLAEREAMFLQKYDCDYFPHVYQSKLEEGYSFIRLEKINGTPLDNCRDYITKTESAFYKFIVHCLRILTYLNEEVIIHRDIRIDNVIMRNSKPVLLDFGWAVSDKCIYFTPDGLGDSGRPPDGSFCDVFSMGKVIQSINQGKYQLYDTVIDMMIEPDNSLRITDLEMLDILFSAVASHENSEK